MTTASAGDVCSAAIRMSKTALHFGVDQHHPTAPCVSLRAQPAAAQMIVCADNLMTAQRKRSRIRKAASGIPPRILLKLEAAVAETFRQAQLRSLDVGASTVPTIRYVGTPNGLASLIADIAVAGVADGVVIVPLPMDDDASSVVGQMIPLLRARNVVSWVADLPDDLALGSQV